MPTLPIYTGTQLLWRLLVMCGLSSGWCLNAISDPVPFPVRLQWRGFQMGKTVLRVLGKKQLPNFSGGFMCPHQCPPKDHVQAGLSISIRYPLETGGAFWWTPPCDVNPGNPGPTAAPPVHSIATDHEITVEACHLWNSELLRVPPLHSPAHPYPKLGLLSWATHPPSAPALVCMSCPGHLPRAEHPISSCAPRPHYSDGHTCLPLLWPFFSLAPSRLTSLHPRTSQRRVHPSVPTSFLPLSSPAPKQQSIFHPSPWPALPEVPSHLLITPHGPFGCLYFDSDLLILLFLPLPPLLATLW